MSEYRDSILLVVVCILGYVMVWVNSLAIVAYINAVFLEDALDTVELLYVNLGVMVLVIALQVVFVLKIRRSSIYRD